MVGCATLVIAIPTGFTVGRALLLEPLASAALYGYVLALALPGMASQELARRPESRLAAYFARPVNWLRCDVALLVGVLYGGLGMSVALLMA